MAAIFGPGRGNRIRCIHPVVRSSDFIPNIINSTTSPDVFKVLVSGFCTYRQREVERLEIEITVLLDFENCLIDVAEVQMNELCISRSCEERKQLVSQDRGGQGDLAPETAVQCVHYDLVQV